MAHRRRTWGVAILSLGAILGAARCTSGPGAPVDARPYAEQIASWRAEKDALFRTGRGSPIPVSRRAAFPGLAYFAVDAAFHVPASLREDRGGPPLIYELPTSSGQPRHVQRVGTLSFTAAGATYALTAFAEEGDINRLFVPFGDLTNTVETYGGGRYLDMDRTPTGLYDLDFNRAYHPFCVYDISYECPVPPRENRLPIAIRAGERLGAATAAVTSQ